MCPSSNIKHHCEFIGPMAMPRHAQQVSKSGASSLSNLVERQDCCIPGTALGDRLRQAGTVLQCRFMDHRPYMSSPAKGEDPPGPGVSRDHAQEDPIYYYQLKNWSGKEPFCSTFKLIYQSISD